MPKKPTRASKPKSQKTARKTPKKAAARVVAKPPKAAPKANKPKRAKAAPKKGAPKKAAPKKESAFARLKAGVGNLLSRVTGRKPERKQPKPKVTVPDQPTIEIMTRDILAERDAGGSGTNQ